MKGRSPITFAVACAGLIAILPTTALGQCSKDTDCKGERICQGGQCVTPSAQPPPPTAPTAPTPMPTPAPTPAPVAAPPPTPAVQCYRDSDCKGTRVCNNNICVDSFVAMRPPGKPGKRTYVTGLVLLSIGAVHVNVGIIFRMTVPGIVNLAVGGASMIVGSILIPVGVHKMRKHAAELSGPPLVAGSRSQRDLISPTHAGDVALGFGGTF